ncbi:MAG TPA: hypothetical protein EYP35_04440 [Desulfobacterales bacterium]|nr:hypothetical protein [Desulfobacterales bacterium]HIP39302.1 hypothetical protein [Desulfocapsa sulfexigens]
MDKLQHYSQYIRERFPVAGALSYSGGLFYAYYFYQSFVNRYDSGILYSLPGFFVVFLSLFHLRLLDDIKDYKKDKELHPQRMLSQGLITKNNLRKLLLLVFVMEFIFSAFYGLKQIYFWLALFLWSMLMSKEFFVAGWLNSRKRIYLASHQIIIPLLGFYAANIAGPTSYGSFSILIFSIAVLSLTLTYELSRKMKMSDEESYPVLWGVQTTVFSAIAVAGIGNMILLFLFFLAGVNGFLYLAATGVFSLFCFAELSFFIHANDRRAKIVKISGALYMLATFLLIIIAYQ